MEKLVSHWRDEFYPLILLVVDLVPDLIEQSNQFCERTCDFSMGTFFSTPGELTIQFNFFLYVRDSNLA